MNHFHKKPFNFLKVSPSLSFGLKLNLKITFIKYFPNETHQVRIFVIYQLQYNNLDKYDKYFLIIETYL